jgi:sigma-B regulation protein RsbQ
MSVRIRNNVTVSGEGPATMLLAHGFGCSQSMWRFMVPALRQRFRIITFDLVGSGDSDASLYDRKKYGTLQGYADDVIEIIDEFATGPVVFVGHSVSAMIGLLASIAAPERFVAQIMVGPSPCHINDGDYVGGFSRDDIDELLDTMDSNYLGWSRGMAPAIMGAPAQPELSVDLTNSFCRNDPLIARHFAKVTFLSDYREALPKSPVPALILQSRDDLIAPCSVGQYMHQTMPDSELVIIDNIGHCPHMSAPAACVEAITDFVDRLAARG